MIWSFVKSIDNGAEKIDKSERSSIVRLWLLSVRVCDLAIFQVQKIIVHRSYRVYHSYAFIQSNESVRIKSFT